MQAVKHLCTAFSKNVVVFQLDCCKLTLVKFHIESPLLCVITHCFHLQVNHLLPVNDSNVINLKVLNVFVLLIANLI